MISGCHREHTGVQDAILGWQTQSGCVTYTTMDIWMPRGAHRCAGRQTGMADTVRLCYLYYNGHMDAMGSTRVCGYHLGTYDTVRLCSCLAALYDNGHMDATGSTQVCGCHTGDYNTVRLCSCLAAEGTGLRHGQLAGSVWLLLRCCC